MVSEKWRAVTGYEGLYEVSSFGRVKSLRKGKIMSPGSGADGYPIVSLYGPQGRKGIAVHRLVALHFVDGKNELHKEAAHLDGDRKNARADNLKWVSKGENYSHRYRHGTNQQGSRHPGAKLSERQAIAIKKGGQSAKALAEKYGISVSTVSDIRTGRRWAYLHESAVTK